MKVRRSEARTSEELQAITEKEPNVVVKFHTTWCSPCKIYDQIIEDYNSPVDIVLCSIDAQKAQDLSQKFKVISVPHTVAFKNGTIVDQRLGLLQNEDFDAFIKKNFT